jgi:hypothetical protein
MGRKLSTLTILSLFLISTCFITPSFIVEESIVGFVQVERLSGSERGNKTPYKYRWDSSNPVAEIKEEKSFSPRNTGILS